MKWNWTRLEELDSRQSSSLGRGNDYDHGHVESSRDDCMHVIMLRDTVEVAIVQSKYIGAL